MEKAMLVEALAPFLAVGVLCISIAWVTTTWMRIKNGYPLENSWGKPVYPKNDQAVERVIQVKQAAVVADHDCECADELGRRVHLHEALVCQSSVLCRRSELPRELAPPRHLPHRHLPLYN